MIINLGIITVIRFRCTFAAARVRGSI